MMAEADAASRSVTFGPTSYAPEPRHATSNNVIQHEPVITAEIIDRCWVECNETEIKEDDKTVITDNLHEDDPQGAGVIPSFPMNTLSSTFNREWDYNSTLDSTWDYNSTIYVIQTGSD